MVVVRATMNETTAPRGKTRSTPTSTKMGSGLAVRPTRLSKAWLVQNDHGDEHPTLRFKFRADGTPLPFQSKGKKQRPVESERLLLE